jgi:hypothetical protein
MVLQRQGDGKGSDPLARAIDRRNQGAKSCERSFSDSLLAGVYSEKKLEGGSILLPQGLQRSSTV